MLDLIPRFLAVSLLVIFSSCTTTTAVTLDGDSYTAQQIDEDLENFLEFVKTTHPDITYTAKLAEIENRAQQVRQSLHDGMSAREAWKAMAQMNPVFKDAHVGLRRPLARIAEYESAGGTLFPATVIIEGNGDIRLSGSKIESLGLRPGDEVLSINGITSKEIQKKLIPLMRGNSAVLGRLIMERYFPQYYWVLHGGFDQYVVRVKKGDTVQTVTLSQNISRSKTDSTPFSLSFPAENIAYMDVSTFEISEKQRFGSFLASAFSKIKTKGIGNLIIDLRKNGGGAHDVSDLLMAYLTGEPYSAISGVKARITTDNIGRIPGAELGKVVKLPFKQTIEPSKNLPNRFDGNVYVLIGSLTYSQAIAFSTTAQDYKIATIVGEETEGPANQTGQVQSKILPNTGFEVLAPIYIFTRANGDTSNRGVVPDLAIKNDPLHPEKSVETLIEILEKNAE